jgi:hypothetical protein
VQGKQIVYVVGKGNKVKSRIIETNGTSGLNFIVTNGLSSDEVVVIEGASKLKDDVEIIPQAIASEDAKSCPTCKIIIKSNNRRRMLKLYRETCTLHSNIINPTRIEKYPDLIAAYGASFSNLYWC